MCSISQNEVRRFSDNISFQETQHMLSTQTLHSSTSEQILQLHWVFDVKRHYCFQWSTSWLSISLIQLLGCWLCVLWKPVRIQRTLTGMFCGDVEFTNCTKACDSETWQKSFSSQYWEDEHKQTPAEERRKQTGLEFVRLQQWDVVILGRMVGRNSVISGCDISSQSSKAKTILWKRKMQNTSASI